MKTWTKYTFVCDPEECDTLIEVTCDNYGFPSGVMKLTCPCGRKLDVLSVADATILPSTTTKEEPMIDTPLSAIEKFNPYATITVFHNDMYSELKSEDISAIMSDKKRYFDKMNLLQSRINRVIDNLTEDNFYGENCDKSDVLKELCEILDFNPVKTVSFSGTMTFSGSMDIPLDELEDFDLTSALEDLYVDIHNGDVEISDYDLYDVEAE